MDKYMPYINFGSIITLIFVIVSQYKSIDRLNTTIESLEENNEVMRENVMILADMVSSLETDTAEAYDELALKVMVIDLMFREIIGENNEK